MFDAKNLACTETLLSFERFVFMNITYIMVGHYDIPYGLYSFNNFVC